MCKHTRPHRQSGHGRCLPMRAHGPDGPALTKRTLREARRPRGQALPQRPCHWARPRNRVRASAPFRLRVSVGSPHSGLPSRSEAHSRFPRGHAYSVAIEIRPEDSGDGLVAPSPAPRLSGGPRRGGGAGGGKARAKLLAAPTDPSYWKLAKCRLAGNMCASRAPVVPEASGFPETSTYFYGLATAVRKTARTSPKRLPDQGTAWLSGGGGIRTLDPPNDG
jgi:hypothetical protein